MVEWSLWCQNPDEKIGTKTFGVRYRIPGEEYILCVGLYEYQAKWLLSVLIQGSSVNPNFYPQIER